MINLFVLAAVVACIARTVTQEEIFREWREWCIEISKDHTRPLAVRKLAYVWTCDYCFSHWVTMGLLLVTGWRLEPWGFLITMFVLVWTANIYLGLFAWLKLTVNLTRARTLQIQSTTTQNP